MSMRTRAAGSVEVTELGFGAAQLGNLFRVTSDDDARDAVETAWTSGIRYFDTAPHYGLGLSERRLGDALSQRRRDSFTVSTKVGRILEPTPERAAAGETDSSDGFIVPATHVRRWDFSRDGILRSIEGSLERLGMDRLDIVYLHDPDDHWQHASTEGVAALIELREQGVITAVGAGMNQTAMLTRFIQECDIDIVMVAGRYTLLDRTAEEQLLPAARDHGVAVVAAAVYNSGLLSSDTITAGATFDYAAASVEKLIEARNLADRCASVNVSLPAAAVQFPLRNDSVASVVVGMRNRSQVEGTVQRYRTEVPAWAWDELEAVSS